MAKATGKAGKRTMAAGRKRPRTRKAGVPNARGTGSRKPNPTKATPRKQKPSAASDITRLKRQLQAARRQQQATAEILRAVANAAGDAARPLQFITETTARLFDAQSVSIQLAEGSEFTQEYRVGAIAKRIGSAYPRSNIKVGGRNLPGTVVAESRQIHIPDLDRLDPSMSDFPGLPHARAGGARTVCGTPLRRDRRAIGALIVFRDKLAPFTDDELALLQTFADQAVIAIENARLFNETKEALERQTATADILKVIASSPSDVQPVFEAIASSANRLIGGFSTAVHLVIDDVVHLSAFTPTNPEADRILIASHPRHRSEVAAVALVENGTTAQFADSETADAHTRELGRARGWRSVTLTPLMDRGRFIGFIASTRRETGLLADHHVEMLKTFADQAVIAIQNTRLFNETREALERQTATADILKVIASSPSDVQPVFEAIAERSNRLVGGMSCAVYSIVDDVMHLMAFTRSGPEADAALRAAFPRPLSEAGWADRIRHGEVAEIADAQAEFASNPALLAMVRLRGYRSQLLVPLLQDARTIGVISVTRADAGAFAPHHVHLLQTFADQAVIAIGNVRLFDEVQAKTRDLEESLQQQTATSEVLQVISSSPGELGPVFDAMLVNAMRLCEASHGGIWLREGEGFRSAALHGAWPEAFVAQWRSGTPVRPTGDAPIMRAAITGKPVLIDDLRDSAAYRNGDALPVSVVKAGIRTVLSVPMFKDEECIGSFGLSRTEVRPFTEKQIELVGNFARQGVIAIENARLLNELRKRTRELSQSLEDLRTAQDRLVQTEKLASLGQLTAGIAHEIKNPLNFVNNFAALSAELTDELDETLAPAPLDPKLRGDVGELTQMLKSNLEKVVQHGKRADSIVRNMLQHSRESSGERRASDLNALVSESLNLAYHGARAERSDFNITLEQDLDPDAGAVEVYPQELTRALLNLISNGFYAAIRRQKDTGAGMFEPVLSAVTRNTGSAVEIRIRDNGTGIPPEIREKIFNPFFTTKPTGEGTGLGLSMTHDIIVKQHGGSIDVATEPGAFTEFTITLPRGNDTAAGEKPE